MTTTNQETRPCPECETGRMTFTTKPETIEYKGHTRTIQSEGWWCNSCDEAVFGPEALAANEKAFLELKADVDGLLKPVEIAAIREKLGLSQRQASELLGGGPRSFQKYESGHVMVSASMSNLLRLLSNDPKRLEELSATPSRGSKSRADIPSPPSGQGPEVGVGPTTCNKQAVVPSKLGWNSDEL